jgi:hypothetical protein
LEPITAIVTALALGAASALKEVAAQSVKDDYAGLKALIQRKYAKVPLAQLEEKPESKSRRDVVAEELTEAGAAPDEELLQHAKAVLDAVQQQAPETAAAIGIDLEEVKGAALRIADVIASGTGVKAKEGELSGDIDIRGVHTGQHGAEPAKKSLTAVGVESAPAAEPFISIEKSAFRDFSYNSSGISNEYLLGLSSSEVAAMNELVIERMIDANLLAERFVPGKVATLTITIRLPSNPARGKWQSTASLDSGGPVAVILEVRGFTLLSEQPPPFEVPQDRDSAPVAFELRIEEANQRWIHAILIQQGRPVGELTINDFSAMDPAPTKQAVNSSFRRIAEADLTLVVRADDGRIEACSPRECASLDHVTMTGFKYPAASFRELLAARLRALYDNRSNPEDTARELRIVGVELAACLPADLITLLRKPDIHSVMLRHEDDFDFPLELCYLDDKVDPFFVGDRIAICRWYLGVKNPPDMTFKHVRKVAFLKGSDDAFKADEALLNRLYPDRTFTFERRSEIIDKVFKTSDYDLIHFTGHCRQENMGILDLADGSFLRLIEIGQLKSESAFTDAQPFVMLNACASAQPYLGLVQRGSFAHRFVTSSACAFVGTLWPVESSVANEFAERFYTALASKPIGQALMAAKRSLMHENARDGSDSMDKIANMRRLAQQVAVRSYCLFANPDLRLL